MSFEIVPSRDRRVARTIELRTDQTLHDLHLAIQSAFELDDDHLYAFYLNNRAWDRMFEYGNSMTPSSQQASATLLGTLPLRLNKRILHLFDFGDDIRHEIRVAAEGTVDASVRYPRILESVGEAPAQYPELNEEFGEEPAPATPRQLDPALAKLVPAVAAALDSYDDRRYQRRGAAPATKAELRGEAELAIVLLDRSAGDMLTIVDFEHAVQAFVWGWLCDLPLELSHAGSTGAGLRLGERVHAIVLRPPISFTLPLLFALDHREGEAREHLERNLAEYPDDPLMLLRAGQTLEALGEPDRAEEAFRESIRWVGGDLPCRREVVGSLVRMLRGLGRVADAEEAQRAEHVVEQERRRLDPHLAWQEPIRRTSPKVGRNELCPCGSGKKAKRCCGAGNRV